MQRLLSLFPFIQKSKNDFEHQNKLLNKVTLTGKINSDERTTNLFEFADNTSQNFAQLKDDLINLLLQENIKNLTNELKSKAEVAIDILIRNLFERTADVGFLATDSQIINFLNLDIKDKNSPESLCLKARLNEYVLKYSVYNEIIIFDIKGDVRINLNDANQISSTNDNVIRQTLDSDDYIERYANTDIFKTQDKTLTYTQKIVHGDSAIGVLCLCFKFEDELKRIFDDLKNDNETILLIENHKIIASNNLQKYKIDTHFKYSHDKYTILETSICVDAITNGYQGYNGLAWRAVAIRDNKNLLAIQTDTSINHTFINDEISGIIEQADNIVADLGDIIINGELIAAKRRIYLLNPILDNLRNISSSILLTIKDAAQNLESLIQESFKFNLLSSSKLSISIMDRNLYERANDSRWWALTPLFIEELSSVTPNEKKLNDVLNYINDLYTVYANLFIYDKNGLIIASSKDSKIIGKTIKGNVVAKTLQNNDAQNYFVSDFEKTEFYNNEATYIYHASINSQNASLGGIAVVFDSTAEFNAILDDSFTETTKGLSLFIDDKGMIISSTDTSLEVTSKYPIDDTTLKNIVSHDIFYDMTNINGKTYILASARSKGYREYKTSDNYENCVIALTLVEI